MWVKQSKKCDVGNDAMGIRDVSLHSRDGVGVILLAILISVAVFGDLSGDDELIGGGIQIDINTADVAMLELLPGIGPRLAEKIVAEREVNGGFVDAVDLRRVSGIGEIKSKRIGELVVFGALGDLSSGVGDDDKLVGEDIRIDINTADVAMLELLPGVGPRLAEKIIAEREANGGFVDAVDLRRVSGIGEVKSKRIGELVVFLANSGGKRR